jgi:hypothetical protein
MKKAFAQGGKRRRSMKRVLEVPEGRFNRRQNVE